MYPRIIHSRKRNIIYIGMLSLNVSECKKDLELKDLNLNDQINESRIADCDYTCIIMMKVIMSN